MAILHRRFVNGDGVLRREVHRPPRAITTLVKTTASIHESGYRFREFRVRLCCIDYPRATARLP
jgi:hypothetical protein